MGVRELQRSSYPVVLTWRTEDHALLVNFLDPRSRLPITHQRVYRDRGTILGLVERSLTPLEPETARAMKLRKDLLTGSGEIEIKITGDMLKKLTSKKKAPPKP